MTARSAEMFMTGQVEGALIASSQLRGRDYWIFRGHGFSAPEKTEIADVARAFERFGKTHSNVPVSFG